MHCRHNFATVTNGDTPTVTNGDTPTVTNGDTLTVTNGDTPTVMNSGTFSDEWRHPHRDKQWDTHSDEWRHSHSDEQWDPHSDEQQSKEKKTPTLRFVSALSLCLGGIHQSLTFVNEDSRVIPCHCAHRMTSNQ